MDETLTLEFDGGSRGNPGPAGIGVVIRAADGTALLTLGRFIGRATNNAAEYRALITGLQQARELGATRISIHGDSELIVKQMRGEYRVKNPDLQLLYREARELYRQFRQASIDHNYREKNALADRLANLAMDRQADVTETAPTAATVAPIDQPAARMPTAGEQWACLRCGSIVEIIKVSSIRPHQLKPYVCQCGSKMSEA